MNIQELEKYISEGYISRTKHPSKDLFIYDYTSKCTYEGFWNDITMTCRGLVLDSSYKIISRPFKKFFNYEELPKLNLKVPEKESFRVLTKYDGSFIQVFIYEGSLIVTTRGSFISEQAKWAEEWLLKNFPKESWYYFKEDFTYCFEVIYKENRIVVDYKDFEGLILLGIIDKETSEELPYKELVKYSIEFGFILAESHPFKDLSELFLAKDSLGTNEEGFVVTYENGFKFKLKGEHYCRIHKMVSKLTPLSFWEVLDKETGKIPLDYLQGLPEEFREHVDFLRETLENLYQSKLERVLKAVKSIPEYPKIAFKERFDYIKESYPDIFHLILHVLNEKLGKAKEYIYREIRPTKNVLEGITIKDSLKRIIENV